MNPVEVHRGNSPIVLGLPHTGTHVPANIFERLNETGRTLSDTDWHIDRLYDGLLDSATTVRATFHRYVIDANRDPSGVSLYPGQNTTGLVPITNFDGKAIWNDAPSDTSVETRRNQFHTPYHVALERELHRVRDLHGIAILYDCHSIRSRIPFLFEGTLPDFSIGTNGGTTCAARIENAVSEMCNQATGFSSVVNGRFKGGWTTRYYGRPAENIHAVQMELAQRTYLKAEALPFEYDPGKAERLRAPLRNILKTLANLALQHGAKT